MNIFNRHSIPFEHTAMLNRLVSDYLTGEQKVKQFFKYPLSFDSIPQIISDKNMEKTDRRMLAEVIAAQYAASLPPQAVNNKVAENIARISDKNTFTVTTGHQLCLFGGPLYVLYKILTVINLAQALNEKYSDNYFVPLFWMASEDHDMEEINHVHVFGKRIEWKTISSLKCPSGKMKTTGIVESIKELQTIINNTEHGSALVLLLQDTYTNAVDLSSATRRLFNALFGKFGLLIFDGDDIKLKTSFKDIMKEDLLQKNSHRLVSETAADLLNSGYKAQVNPREVNFFYIKDELRSRITNPITIGSDQWNEIDLSPERFSPNVITRPLYQEKILPNVAYIGGPAEIAYWLQFRKMFEHYGVNFPLLVLRTSAFVMDENIQRMLKKYEINHHGLFSDADNLVKNFLMHNSGSATDLSEEFRISEKLFTLISERIAAIDPTLLKSVEAEKTKHFNMLGKLSEKLLRAEKKKQETAVNQIRKIKERLFPNGVMQERHDSFIQYYAQYGMSFIASVKEHFYSMNKDVLFLEAQEARLVP